MQESLFILPPYKIVRVLHLVLFADDSNIFCPGDDFTELHLCRK